MSLINQMLQDLEKRHASASERGPLPNQVRVLPQTQKSALPWWLAGAALVLVAALAWHYYLRPVAPVAPITPPVAQADIAPPPAPAAVAPALVLKPTNEVSSVVASHEPKESREERPAATTRSPIAAQDVLRPAPAASKSTDVNSKTKAETAAPKAPPAKVAAVDPPVSASPAPAAAVQPVLAVAIQTVTPPSKTPAATEAPPVARPAAAVPPAAPVVAAKPVDSQADSKVQAALANSQIDKRNQQLTPLQLAENEYRRAASALSQGKLAEAQDGFKLALQHNPMHIGARQGLYGLLLEAKRPVEAEQVLQDGLKFNPNQPNLALVLSSLQYERGDTAGAIDTLQKSAPAAQSSPDYLARLAALLQRQSRHAEAVEYYQSALRLAPGSGVWLMGLGISQQALNRNAEAQDAFRRAKATNTLNSDLQAFVDQRLRQLQ